jgi:hypothetical protein
VARPWTIVVPLLCALAVTGAGCGSSEFLRAGVPAVDFIDWRYPGHELSDRLDKLSPESLDAVGETVVELTLRLR